MIKKILFTIFFIIFFTHAVFSQEVFKITSVNFDTSNSMIFLTSPDNTTEAIMKNIKLIKLKNPKRVYFDINNTVLTAAPQNWFFNTGGIKQVKVHQFCVNPNKVRVLLYLEDDFDQSKISFLKVNNNIVINFKDGMCQSEYFQNTYRDEKKSSSDFYENLSISNQDIEKIKESINTAKNTEGSEDALNQIQQAFNSNVKPVGMTTQEVIKKELKLKSKYYLNLIEPKPNGFLLSGFGAVGIEKPMYLTSPPRVIFDIPNTIVNPEIKNKEFSLGKDIVKIGQYESNKARIVVTSGELDKYFPIFSADGQSVLFVNTEKIDLGTLFNKTTDAVGYYERKLTPTSDEFIIAFSSPVVHSIRRDNSKLTINFHNALRYNDKSFREAVEQTDLSEMKIDLLPKVGLKLSLPLEKDAVVSCYLGADGKSVKIIVKGVKQKQKSCLSPKNIILPKCNGKKSVVIDAGHGGSDYGAIRCGINEKDINLDVARRVQAILMSKGVSVIMTRNTDDFVSLPDRTTITANTCPDIFVSVHVNSSSKPQICGIETHYYHPESLNLAQDVHSCLISDLRSFDRGLFKSKFYVINHTTVPAILVEIGFISNDSERSELVSEERKQQTAQAIAEGILKYLNKK